MWQNKIILVILVSLLCALQYRLWFGKRSIPEYLALQAEVEQRQQQNANLTQRNKLLAAD
ncbi:MAG: septum formation initiator family protein, partial [Glaciecola sp.]